MTPRQGRSPCWSTAFPQPLSPWARPSTALAGRAGVGVGGTTASATNFTNSQVPNGTVITGLRIYSDSMTNDEAFAKYKSHMAQFGRNRYARL